MVNPISRRLHLFPRHIGHTKAASGCADPLLRRHLIRRGDRDLRCPFRLQKFRHLGEAKAVTVIQNTITEISVLCQQVKEIAHQHTEGAAGNDVGGIIAGSCTLLFSDFCIMLFQYGSQRRKLRRLQFGKIIPVPERQVASGNEPVVKLFLRDLAVVL